MLTMEDEKENGKGSDHPTHKSDDDDEEVDDFNKPATIRLEGKNLVRKYDDECSDSLGRLLSPTRMDPRKKTHHNNSNNKSSKKKRIVPGEEAFDFMIEQAEFEARHDPYRGLGLMLDESKRRERHPWKVCQFGSSLTAATTANNQDDDSDEEEEAFDYGQNLVQSVYQCNCPSLIRWANEANDKRNRKRKRKRKKTSSSTSSDETTPAFAGRPEEGDVRCACDYNPFCLATCGGAMNEALTKRLQDFSSDGQHSDRGTEGDENDDGGEVEVLDEEGKTSDLNKNTLYDPTNPKSLYSKATRKKLKNLRKDLYVDVDPIHCYLKGVLEDMTSVIPITECLRLVQKRHQSLIFVNPLVDNENDEKKRMRLSVPPGIENLGATCYLNTQLQCLAQNLIFSQGIFSWRPPSTTSDNSNNNNTEDRMTSVIRLFQQLLLRMNSGPFAVLNTLEFSNALGLDHYEQQDPNEFSRLFFDRLHDSFQRISSTEEGGNGLKGLLPHLFEGISAYETTCLSCQATSTRKELFMDINLPIVDPIDKQKKKSGQQKLDEVYASKMDVSVQDCLNSYCSAEVLEGDNQYFCSECNSKQDAKRSLSFEKLPPVLNVQLSRYVFDRATLMKKKLGNKVLLPLELRVQGKDRVRKAGNVEHRYLLTAVMRHQGTSAYSGHYVAEAMDWMTGQWFEFNDEKVTFLSKGPSCSFDPTTKVKGDSPTGSKDAYNMYYVEESFLAQSVVEAIRAQTRASPDHGITTVESISIERTAEYSDVAQMCLDDMKAWNQLDRRRLMILDSIVPSLFSRQATELKDYVWVDGDELRQFLSCKKVLNLDQSSSDDLPLQYRRFRCSHPNQGFHPRLARRGKLIPKEAYNAYLSLLRQELGSDWTPDDCMTPGDVYCGECCADYRQELSHKIGRAQTLRRLYDALDPKYTFSLHIGALELLNDESDKYAFIVSRKFITWFRRQVERIMKPATAIGDTKGKSDIQAERSICETIAEGLDAMDISLLTQLKSSTEAELESEDSEKVVNESISCEHGKCVATSKRNIRYVPWSVWRDIETVFPKSIEHRRSRIGYQEVEEIDNYENVCHICTMRENSVTAKRETFLQLLNSLEKVTRRKILTQDSLVEKEVEAQVGFLAKYRVLHNDDIESWNRFISRAKRKLLSKETEIDNETRETLLPSRNWDVSVIQSFQPDADTTTGTSSFLSKVMRPIVCTKHNLPIAAALFRHGGQGSSLPLRLLDDRLCVVEETEYQKMVSTLSILVSEMLDPESDTGKLYDVDRDYPAGVEWCHPSFVRYEGCIPRSDPSHVFAIQSKKMSTFFRLDSCVCDDETCNESFSEWRNAEDSLLTEAKSDSDNVSARDSTQALGSASSDPIPIDSDDDVTASDKSTLISVKVFEAEKSASIDSILKSLSMSPEPTPKDTSLLQRFLRRSTRQRKTRYPSGVILAEDSIDIDPKSNIAALRLLLLERISNGETFELSHTLRLVVPVPVDDQLSSSSPVVVDISQPAASIALSSPHVIDLPLDKSAVIFEDLLRSVLGSEKKLDLKSLDLVIIRQSEDDPNAKDIPKDAMMDHMIGLSNTAEIADSRPQKKRKTRVERGFTGTFLASRSDAENDGGKVEKDACGTTNADREHIVTSRSEPENDACKFENDTCVTTNSGQEQITDAIERNHGIDTRVSGQTGSDGHAEMAKSKQYGVNQRSLGLSSNSDNIDVEMIDAYDCKLHKGDSVELVHTDPVDGRRNTVAPFGAKADTSCDVDMSEATQLERSGHDIVDDSCKKDHRMQEACLTGKPDYVNELQIDSTEGLQDAPDSFAATTSPNFGSWKENVIDWEHQPGSPTIGRNVNSIESSAQDESSSYRILMLVQLLLQNPDVRKSDESRCYDAATWAIQNDPTMQDDLLLQHAYAKYLDLCQAGT